MSKPFFTVIVVCLNAEQNIDATMNSIFSQTYSDYEVVVKDGLSADKTLEHVPARSNVRVYSQKDKSVYDAMNQATTYAQGKYVIYMNCGDAFASPDVLEKVWKAIGNGTYSMVYGDLIRAGVRYNQASSLSKYYFYRRPLNHQSVFFYGELLQEAEPYNMSYKIIADHDLETRLFQTGRQTLHVDIPVCVYQGGGLSETVSGEKKRKEERKRFIRSHYSKKERFIYGLKWHLTLPTLRAYLVSDKTPLAIRKIYQMAVDPNRGKK